MSKEDATTLGSKNTNQETKVDPTISFPVEPVVQGILLDAKRRTR